MLGNIPFYFHSIKKITEAFLYIFSDISIQRIDPDTGLIKEIKVPIDQAAKEKWAVRMEEDPNAGNEATQRHVQIILPRMSADLTNFHYDSHRKLPAINYRATPSGNGPYALIQLNPIPYIFDYSLHLQTRTLSDSYMIVEQILAFFRPDYVVPIIDIKEMNIHRDIVFTLTNCSHQDSFEGSLDTKRVIEWEFSFQAQAFIYPPIKQKPVITTANVYTPEFSETSTSGGLVEVVSNPSGINIDQPYDFIVSETNG